MTGTRRNTLFKTLELTRALIQRESITPNDSGCQQLIREQLTDAGFTCEDLPFGNVKNLWARKGTTEPLLIFAGHTDVVPTGPREQWKHDPFAATIEGDYLYGRGAADMKSGLSAMICAAIEFVKTHPNHQGSIAFLITSDEEGASIDGTDKVIDYLEQQGLQANYCIVGEASSINTLGDTLKIGRRGTLSGNLTVFGKQGHIAYPHLADNPIHTLAPVLTTLCNTEWDHGYENFDPTTFQFSNIHMRHWRR